MKDTWVRGIVGAEVLRYWEEIKELITHLRGVQSLSITPFETVKLVISPNVNEFNFFNIENLSPQELESISRIWMENREKMLKDAGVKLFPLILTDGVNAKNRTLTCVLATRNNE